jgi:hypothetical protein
MSIVKLTLPLGEIPVNGKQVTFTAPCDCTVTECLQIDGVNYTIVDALGNCVTGKGGRWAAGATISVTLDTDNKRAYILTQPDEHSADDITSGILPVERGGTGVASMAALFTALGCAQTKLGSYTGTGTVGSDSPNTLTFAFVPKAVMVMREGVVCFFINGCPYGYGLYTNPAGGSLYTVFQAVTWSDKTLSWYCSGCYASNDGGAYTITPSNQLNYNETYHYIAIG